MMTFVTFDCPDLDGRIATGSRVIASTQYANMGLHFSRIWERMFGKKEMRILMVGLDAAGKVRCSPPLSLC